MKTLFGLLALVFYLAHAADCVRRGHGEDALWACHIATAAIAAGLLLGIRSCVALGCYCLTIGTPLWLVEAGLSRDVLATSFGTHVGGLLLGWVGLALVRTPARAWWKGVLALAALQQACRWWTPEAANVNGAFAVYDRFTPLFLNYAWYVATLAIVAAVTFWSLECALRTLFPEAGA